MSLQIEGLGQVIDEFDLYLIDQYGVLHNGVEPYPHAVKTLHELKQKGKHVVVVSNSGKRAAANISRIAAMGFEDQLFDQFVSSGELAFRYLKSQLSGTAPQSCFLIARDNDTSAIDDLNLAIVDSPDEADMILISGCEPEKFSETDYRELLHSAAQSSKTCMCTNPDKKMLTSDGLVFAAGRIAEIYEELGGEVKWIGKPLSPIYEYILTLYAEVDRDRVLCIGDSVEHDIAGGHNAQLKTLLVKTGIVNDAGEDQLLEEFQRYGAEPDFIAPQLNY